MENGPFEDVFPIKTGIFHCHVRLSEGNMWIISRALGVSEISVTFQIAFVFCFVGPDSFLYNWLDKKHTLLENFSHLYKIASQPFFIKNTLAQN